MLCMSIASPFLPPARQRPPLISMDGACRSLAYVVNRPAATSINSPVRNAMPGRSKAGHHNGEPLITGIFGVGGPVEIHGERKIPFFKFEKTDTTGNRQWDLVKMQCVNRSNLVGNKRRDILPLLNKRKKRHIQKQLNKYRNELQGLEAHLQAKIDDFDQFVPGGYAMPRHFLEFPALE
ncbi:uncharacterized protein LOC119366165 isoform X2 [Triticum dicoccoides]|uniref:uncharacterized protein LOC119366165 isoform X2 n=1 Tax=Triticum dicoccoides TaxID=85692 RepID=UPI000E7C0B2B|nr:uncharacterized protein LOC119366165 isoform X2 [Triticum dicoccoides]